MKPLFKWFGSKWAAAKHYPKPRFETVVEPFGGGAGYSLYYNIKHAYIGEQNQHLRDLWVWLIGDARPELIRQIPIDLEVGLDIRKVPGLSYGQQLLVKHWQRTNNVGDCWTVSPWGNSPGQWTANTRSRVAEEVVGVKGWTLLPRNNLESWEREAFSYIWKREGCTYFVDPPYQWNYQYRSPAIDYVRLARIVDVTIPQNNQVIVCEARCPKTDAMPDWLPFTEHHRSVTSRRKTTDHHHSTECVYIRDNEAQ